MVNDEKIETHIISSATDMFLSKGFKSVTMDDLASNMGMSKKTIYSYFKTKGKLVAEVTNYLSDVISSGIDYISAQNYNPIEEIYIIDDFVREKIKNDDSSPIYQLQKYYPKIHENLIKKQFNVANECIVKNLTRGISQGVYRSYLDVNFISRLYFSSAIKIKDEEVFPRTNFSNKELTTNFIDYHIHGIATEKGLNLLEQIKQKRKK